MPQTVRAVIATASDYSVDYDSPSRTQRCGGEIRRVRSLSYRHSLQGTEIRGLHARAFTGFDLLVHAEAGQLISGDTHFSEGPGPRGDRSPTSRRS